MLSEELKQLGIEVTALSEVSRPSPTRSHSHLKQLEVSLVDERIMAL